MPSSESPSQTVHRMCEEIGWTASEEIKILDWLLRNHVIITSTEYLKEQLDAAISRSTFVST